MTFLEHYTACRERRMEADAAIDPVAVERLADEMVRCRGQARSVYLAGNGGSAAAAIHAATDLQSCGICAWGLPANVAMITALANDYSYQAVFSQQLLVHGCYGDALIVFSGSGNSPNVLAALDMARIKGIWSCAIVGGGKAVGLASHVVLIDTDMQSYEDLCLAPIHAVMRWLRQEPTCVS